MRTATGLTFFCELEPESLNTLFQNRFVLDDLKTLKATVSLGILDFSDERAAVVRKMNRIGVPVRAWLLLPKDQGYWFNLENYAFAIARYEAFKSWSQAKKLKWEGIGLDIEPDFQQMADIRHRTSEVIAKAIKRFKNTEEYKQALLAYTGLVQQIHTDGFQVESYHFPLIVDDRKAKSTVVQRLAGLVDIPVDREVLMLYSSFFRPYGHTLLWSYANQAEAIGIGNTGGGVKMEGLEEVPYLTWEEFSTDLHLACRSEKPVYVFSLEGCVKQGFLEPLITFDCEQPVTLPKTGGLSTLRGILHALLWLLQRPFVILAGILGILGSIFFLHEKKKSPEPKHGKKIKGDLEKFSSSFTGVDSK